MNKIIEINSFRTKLFFGRKIYPFNSMLSFPLQFSKSLAGHLVKVGKGQNLPDEVTIQEGKVLL